MTPFARAREGQLNPDTDIVEAALDAHSLPEADHRAVWEALHVDGKTAHQIATMTEARFPGFAATLRRATATRRGQRFGGHGG